MARTLDAIRPSITVRTVNMEANLYTAILKFAEDCQVDGYVAVNYLLLLGADAVRKQLRENPDKTEAKEKLASLKINPEAEKALRKALRDLGLK